MRLKFLLAGSIIVLICSGFDFQRGDLVFQTGGKTEFSAAITDATAMKDTLKFDHVGIIDIDTGGEIIVIEASPRKGVCITRINEFLASANTIEGKPGVVVKRLNREFPVDDVLSSARSHIGEDYDWWYLPDNGKMYCSELIYESYVDESGEHFFSTRPMNFRGTDGTMPEFWVKLFERIGEDIPEGEPGTNPSDMSKESVLTEVYRFF